MTTTSSDSTDRLFQAGPYYVSVVTMEDKDFAGGKRRMYAVTHEKHEVIAAIGPMLSGAIRAAVALDKDLKDAITDPSDEKRKDEPSFTSFPRFS